MELKAKPETSCQEEHLIQESLKGDDAALDVLFSPQLPALYRSALKVLGNREDAEDALQEGLLSAFRNLSRFEKRSKFSTWLTRIVINAALMRRRSQRIRATVSMDELLGETDMTLAEQLADPARDPEQVYAQEELRRTLDRGLSGLSPDMRTALRLRSFEGVSIKEAAETLGVRENTLKSRLRRARFELALRIKSARAGKNHQHSVQNTAPAMSCL